MDVESLKTFFEVGGVILLALTFIFGAGAWRTGKIVNERQSEKLRTFDVNLTAAKTSLEAQTERAATAEGKIAGLQRSASEALIAQQRVQTDLAAQRERAAIAERELLEVRDSGSIDSKPHAGRLSAR